MDTESIIKNQIENSISVKEAILTDAALLKNIQDAAEMLQMHIAVDLKPYWRAMAEVLLMPSILQGNL